MLQDNCSGPNEATVERRALVSQLISVEARFHPENTDVTYSRDCPP